ncbi:MAG: substrate-binding domain-containing protein [Phycisphaerae bacterium]
MRAVRRLKICSQSNFGTPQARRLFMPFAMLFAMAIFLFSGGCKQDSKPASKTSPVGENTSTMRVGVTLLNVQDQFYQDMRDGMKDAASDLGIDLLITSAEKDSARQANQIDEFIMQGVSAIVISPCDSRSVGASIVEANEAGIPVFTADIANTSPIGKVVSHIASDNVMGGRLAAGLLSDALQESGKIAILSHPEVSSVMDRVRGFKEALVGKSQLQVVSELSSDGNRSKAARVMEDLLQSHPDVNGVFCINDSTALGALASIEAAGLAGKIKIVGYDATPEARKRIADGGMVGDVIQYPDRIGRLTMQAVKDHLQGKNLDAVIPVEVGTFTNKDTGAGEAADQAVSGDE